MGSNPEEQRTHYRIRPYIALQWVPPHTPPPGRNEASRVPPPLKGPCGMVQAERAEHPG